MGELRYRDQSEICEVVRRFETCDYTPEEFFHARHLTVACWYLNAASRELALLRMRSGLMRFISHHGKQGYNETITRFWMELLGDFLEQHGGDDPVLKINEAIARFGTKEILFTYYTRERALSETAKRNWVEPDLRRLRVNADGVMCAEKISETTTSAKNAAQGARKHIKV